MLIELLMRKAVRFLKSGSTETRDYKNYIRFLKENPFQYKKSYFNLTIDLELAWSRARRGESVMSKDESLKRSRRARTILPALFSLSEKHKIPITFATVGHLALTDCSDHRPPPDFHPRWITGDWYDIDSHSGSRLDKDYCGLDIIKQINQSGIHHEIASHSFSHVDIADDETTEEVAAFEIMESFSALKKVDENLRTFVFPNNRVAHLSILKETGFDIYRDGKNGKAGLDQLGLFQFPLGLWLSPQAFSPKALVKLIDIATERKQIINVWCHLYEFGSHKQFLDFFEPIFIHVELCRRDGIIEALTMRDIVKDLNE